MDKVSKTRQHPGEASLCTLKLVLGPALATAAAKTKPGHCSGPSLTLCREAVQQGEIIRGCAQGEASDAGLGCGLGEEAFKPLRCPGEASEDWQQNRGGEGR